MADPKPWPRVTTFEGPGQPPRETRPPSRPKVARPARELLVLMPIREKDPGPDLSAHHLVRYQWTMHGKNSCQDSSIQMPFS